MAIAVLLFAATGMAQKPEWQKVVSSRGKFSVKMPGKPKIKKDKLDSGVDSNKYSVNIGDGVCFASYTQMEVGNADEQQLAQVGLKAFVDQLGADLTQADVWKVGKNKGRMAIMENKEQGLEAYYRVVIVDDIMYQLAIAYGNNTPVDKKIAKKFLNSFKLSK